MPFLENSCKTHKKVSSGIRPIPFAVFAFFLMALNPAHSQSGVIIKGIVDTGYAKESGSDARMRHNKGNRLSFSGKEEIGGGIYVTFDLERRFNLHNGTPASPPNRDDKIHMARGPVQNSVEWGTASNIGLGGQWGRIRLGRMYNLAKETYSRIDPFAFDSIGAALPRSGMVYAEAMGNTARYDSPSFNGFSFGLAYSLGADQKNATATYQSPAGIRNYYQDRGNDGFNIMMQYDKGPLYLLGNIQRLADSNKSWLWNVAAGYKLETMRFTLGYHDSRYKEYDGMAYTTSPLQVYPEIQEKSWLLGFVWELGTGQINASFNYGKYKGYATQNSNLVFPDGHVTKYTIGYTYKLSKRTSLYGIVTYLNSTDEFIGKAYHTNGIPRASMTGIQLGMQHRF